MNHELDTAALPLPETTTLPPVEAPTPAPAATIDYTRPLPIELRTQLAKDLASLKEQWASGWQEKYPALNALLQALVKEFSGKVKCAEPVILLNKAFPYAEQAAAFIMPDGSSQIHIGTDCLTTFVISPAAGEEARLMRSFRWIIAHELGHLADPALARWARWHKVRLSIVRWSNILTTMGLFSGLFSCLPYLATIASPHYLSLLVIGLTVKGAFNLVEIFIQRSFEYTADAATLQTGDDFAAEDAAHALQVLNAAIAAARATQPKPTLQLRLLNFKVSFWHPSVEKRLAAMQK